MTRLKAWLLWFFSLADVGEHGGAAGLLPDQLRGAGRPDVPLLAGPQGERGGVGGGARAPGLAAEQSVQFQPGRGDVPVFVSPSRGSSRQPRGQRSEGGGGACKLAKVGWLDLFK